MDAKEYIQDYIKEHKIIVIIAIAAICGILVMCLSPSSGVYRAIHKGGANKLNQTLESEEWVCYEVVSLLGIERKAGEVLVFENGTVSQYVIPDGNIKFEGKEIIVRKKENEWNYSLPDGKTLNIDFNGLKIKSEISFEENNNVMVMSPSIIDGEKNKKWYKKDYFVEKYPEHSKLFN